MCVFHEIVARDIATDIITGHFDPARYIVARVVLARYHIEQYMPDMFGCSGCCSADMTSDIARKEFAASGLRRPISEMTAYRDKSIHGLQEAMRVTGTKHDLTISGLKLPADIMQDDSFMNEAVVDLLEGYTGSDAYASELLTLKKLAHKEEFEPLRSAAEYFLNQPNIEPILKRMMEDSIARLFIAANNSAYDFSSDVRCGNV
jgi:hypothetical protein